MGSMEFVTNESKSKERSKEDNSSESPINYPVGKPLEVSLKYQANIVFRSIPKTVFFIIFVIIRSIWSGRMVHRPVTYSEPSTP